MEFQDLFADGSFEDENSNRIEFFYSKDMACPIQGCSGTYGTKKSYQRHWDEKHLFLSISYQCPLSCGVSCKRKPDLRQHLERKHSKTKEQQIELLAQVNKDVVENKKYVNPELLIFKGKSEPVSSVSAVSTSVMTSCSSPSFVVKVPDSCPVTASSSVARSPLLPLAELNVIPDATNSSLTARISLEEYKARQTQSSCLPPANVHPEHPAYDSMNGASELPKPENVHAGHPVPVADNVHPRLLVSANVHPEHPVPVSVSVYPTGLPAPVNVHAGHPVPVADNVHPRLLVSANVHPEHPVPVSVALFPRPSAPVNVHAGHPVSSSVSTFQPISSIAPVRVRPSLLDLPPVMRSSSVQSRLGPPVAVNAFPGHPCITSSEQPMDTSPPVSVPDIHAIFPSLRYPGTAVESSTQTSAVHYAPLKLPDIPDSQPEVEALLRWLCNSIDQMGRLRESAKAKLAHLKDSQTDSRQKDREELRHLQAENRRLQKELSEAKMREQLFGNLNM